MPFADHNAMLDPSCPDITARVLEALGHYGYTADHPRVERDADRKVRAARFTRQAIILVGAVFGERSAERSRLYEPGYVHLFRT